MITIPATSGPTATEDVGARPRADQSLLDAVTDLRRDVGAVRLPLPIEGVQDAEESRRRLLDQLDDHLLPRLRELSAPAVVVVAGSTGAGKSTLVNSLLQDEVTTAGVLRPTTRRPVLVHHPDDGDLLSEHPLMEVVRVASHPAVPRGLTLLDAPDLDSLEDANRATAHRLLEAADLWVFVTTAARYGDALPWQFLQRAADRGTSMAMVLNRVPAAALKDVRTDLMARLREHGMAAVPLFLVPDVGPHQGLLEATTVAPINRWLAMVAGPDRARSVIARTQRGALKALRPWVDTLVTATQSQVDARARLEQVVAQAEDAAQAVAATDTTLLAEGPVRGAWEARAGRGGPLTGWTSRRGRARRVQALEEVRAELLRGATLVLTACRARASSSVARALDECGEPAAAGVLDRLADGDVAWGDAPDPAAAAAEWVAAVDADVRDRVTSEVGRHVDRLARGVGLEGVATLVLAAAAGLGAAAVVVERELGSVTGRGAADRAREGLVARATAQARAGGGPARHVLASPHLADDAAAGLRLRSAVLKGVS